MFVEDIIKKLDELKAEGKVRDWDYYQEHEDEEAAAHQDGFIWVDEIDEWVRVD